MRLPLGRMTPQGSPALTVKTSEEILAEARAQTLSEMLERLRGYKEVIANLEQAGLSEARTFNTLRERTPEEVIRLLHSKVVEAIQEIASIAAGLRQQEVEKAMETLNQPLSGGDVEDVEMRIKGELDGMYDAIDELSGEKNNERRMEEADRLRRGLKSLEERAKRLLRDGERSATVKRIQKVSERVEKMLRVGVNKRSRRATHPPANIIRSEVPEKQRPSQYIQMILTVLREYEGYTDIAEALKELEALVREGGEAEALWNSVIGVLREVEEVEMEDLARGAQLAEQCKLTLDPENLEADLVVLGRIIELAKVNEVPLSEIRKAIKNAETINRISQRVEIPGKDDAEALFEMLSGEQTDVKARMMAGSSREEEVKRILASLRERRILRGEDGEISAHARMTLGNGQEIERCLKVGERDTIDGEGRELLEQGAHQKMAYIWQTVSREGISERQLWAMLFMLGFKGLAAGAKEALGGISVSPPDTELLALFTAGSRSNGTERRGTVTRIFKDSHEKWETGIWRDRVYKELARANGREGLTNRRAFIWAYGVLEEIMGREHGRGDKALENRVALPASLIREGHEGTNRLLQQLGETGGLSNEEILSTIKSANRILEIQRRIEEPLAADAMEIHRLIEQSLREQSERREKRGGLDIAPSLEEITGTLKYRRVLRDQGRIVAHLKVLIQGPKEAEIYLTGDPTYSQKVTLKRAGERVKEEVGNRRLNKICYVDQAVSTKDAPRDTIWAMLYSLLLKGLQEGAGETMGFINHAPMNVLSMRTFAQEGRLGTTEILGTDVADFGYPDLTQGTLLADLPFRALANMVANKEIPPTISTEEFAYFYRMLEEGLHRPLRDHDYEIT